MASACGGHSSPPPWWRFLGVSSSFCYGGPSNICGLFAVTATLNTRYVCWPINSLSFWICSYINTDAHAIHILVYFYGTDLTSCSIMAFITQAAFPLAESDGFLFMYIFCTPRSAVPIEAPLEWIQHDCYCPLAVYYLPLLNEGGDVAWQLWVGWEESSSFILFSFSKTQKYPHAMSAAKFSGESVDFTWHALVLCNHAYDPALLMKSTGTSHGH